jgi:hypothetical protein
MRRAEYAVIRVLVASIGAGSGLLIGMESRPALAAMLLLIGMACAALMERDSREVRS